MPAFVVTCRHLHHATGHDRFVDTRLFEFTESTMARKHPPYAPEFRRQMVELVRAGRMPEELANEFDPSAQGNPQLGRAGGSWRGPARGWSDDGRARGVLNRRNHPFTKIQRIGSTHGVLASTPASSLNQRPTDLGIPNRFRLKSSRSSVSGIRPVATGGTPQARGKGLGKEPRTVPQMLKSRATPLPQRTFSTASTRCGNLGRLRLTV
jgi:hypothetical protein